MPFLHLADSHSTLRCSASELLAFAVQDLFPTVLLIGGEETSIGFFYDFVFEQPLYEGALALIETRMKALVKEGIEIRSLEMMRENAETFFIHHDQPLLAEKAIQDELNIVSLIQIGDFYDLCPAVKEHSTQQIGAIKLLEILKIEQGGYADEGLAVTRINGTAFANGVDLKQFLKALHQLPKKDHRVLGQELDLFSYVEAAGNIECLWHPKGEWLRKFLIQQWEEWCKQRHAHFIHVPLVVKESFVKQKGLFPACEYKEQAYVLSQSRLLHCVYFLKRRSLAVSELPIRLAECAREYQALKEGQFWGLLQAYSYDRDTLVTCCTKEQVLVEVISSLHFIKQIVKIFGFEGQWYLTYSEQKNSKTKREDPAVKWLTQAMERCDLPYKLILREEEALQEACLELRLCDCLGREWSVALIEIAVDSIHKLQLFYEDENNQRKVPVILRTSVFGSLDRFIALFLEQQAGILPVWAAPEQVRILMIGNQNHEYAWAIYQECQQQNIRVHLDKRPEKLGTRIHEAEKERIPYLILIGDKEREKKLVTVRTLKQKNVNDLISLDSFLKKLQEECRMPS